MDSFNSPQENEIQEVIRLDEININKNKGNDARDVSYRSVIESLLFVSGDPIELKKIAGVLEMPVNWCKEILRDMMIEYNTKSRGIHLIQVNSSYQFVTNRGNSSFLEKMYKSTKSKGLSSSALEVLTLTAYKQPITKGEIDAIRGVKSDKPLQTLIDRELIEERGRLKKIGTPIIYGTSDSFLKAFGFTSLRDLPDITDFENFNLFEGLNDEEGVSEKEAEETTEEINEEKSEEISIDINEETGDNEEDESEKEYETAEIFS